jgi:non-ribosomal peptide synthase protein (TIGR01720 family)
MDGLSWRPFWEDFEEIYASLDREGSASLPPPSTSFEEWAHALKHRADSAELRAERDAWLGLAWDRVRPVPLDRPTTDGANTNESAREVVLEFSEDETRAIFQETPRVRHKVDFLLTSLAHVMADWTGSDTSLLDLMGHGRDEDAVDGADLAGSVGFFISYTPMVLTVQANGANSGSALLTDQIQPILNRGLSFDLLRYMTSDATIRQTFSALPRAQVLFNHMGRRDSLDTVPSGSSFSQALESMGETHSPSGIRYYPLAISSQIWRGRLMLNFVYSENLHERSTVERLAEEFRRSLLDSAARLQGA